MMTGTPRHHGIPGTKGAFMFRRHIQVGDRLLMEGRGALTVKELGGPASTGEDITAAFVEGGWTAFGSHEELEVLP
jgi:hypothetical protein